VNANGKKIELRTPVLWAKSISNGKYLAPDHVWKIDKAITDTLSGVDGVRRLMISVPPRHGKSELCSKYLPAWFLGGHPNSRVILTSYEASFAASWGRKARNLLEEHGSVFDQSVAASPSAADQWDLKGFDGGMMTAGAGGAITGKGCSLAIIDDPHKNAEEAASQTMRDKIWDWYQSTLYTRLEPNGAIIVIQTRWHENDLCGRLLEEEKNGGDQWRKLVLPAIDNKGEALWPSRYSLEQLMKIKRSVGAYHWEALYQQNPTPREGNFFKVNNLGFLDVEPTGMRCVRAWDLAATESDGDYTAGVKVGQDKNGRIIVCDVKRGQWSTDERDRWLRLTAESDGNKCRIRLPQDPGQAGKSQKPHLTRLLAGFSMSCETVSGKKITRADPFSTQVNGGNVWLIRGEWNRDFIEELRQFDKGKHDDQVDAVADAYNELVNRNSVTAFVADTKTVEIEKQENKFSSMLDNDFIRETWERIIRSEQVCPKWKESYAAFRSDMGEQPTSKHEIKLRNKFDFWGPDNCYWSVGDEEPPKPKRRFAFIAD